MCHIFRKFGKIVAICVDERLLQILETTTMFISLNYADNPLYVIVLSCCRNNLHLFYKSPFHLHVSTVTSWGTLILLENSKLRNGILVLESFFF